MAWLAGCRRLHRRHERKAEHFLAFTGIGLHPHPLPQALRGTFKCPHGCGTPSPPRGLAAHSSSCVRFTGRSSSVAGAGENGVQPDGDAGATVRGREGSD